MQNLASHPKVAPVQLRTEHDIIAEREIERKYTVGNVPENLEKYPHVEIFQAYVKITDPAEWNDIAETYFQRHPWVGKMGAGCLRVRKKGDRYILTVKKRVDQSTREERYEAENKDLTEVQFKKFRDRAGDFALEKTRYMIPYKGLVIELDVYKGKLAGHMVAEVEFTSKEEGMNFTPPDWFGKNVTDDDRYSNKTLAKEQKIPCG